MNGVGFVVCGGGFGGGRWVGRGARCGVRFGGMVVMGQFSMAKTVVPVVLAAHLLLGAPGVSFGDGGGKVDQGDIQGMTELAPELFTMPIETMKGREDGDERAEVTQGGTLLVPKGSDMERMLQGDDRDKDGGTDPRAHSR